MAIPGQCFWGRVGQDFGFWSSRLPGWVCINDGGCGGKGRWARSECLTHQWPVVTSDVLPLMPQFLQSQSKRDRAEKLDLSVEFLSLAPPPQLHISCPNLGFLFLPSFKVFADYEAYVQCQEKVSNLYKVRQGPPWTPGFLCQEWGVRIEHPLGLLPQTSKALQLNWEAGRPGFVPSVTWILGFQSWVLSHFSRTLGNGLGWLSRILPHRGSSPVTGQLHSMPEKSGVLSPPVSACLPQMK